MTNFATAVRDLRTILIEENTALRRGDPAATPALIAQKAEAAAVLTEAAATAPRTYYAQALAEQLHELAAENATLLQDAIAVQTQLIAIVTRAALASARATERPGYDQHGADPKLSSAVAMMHRA